MSNSFNISVKPEIAAAVVKIDANKTVIDENKVILLDIQGTKITGIITEIHDNETLINTAITDIGLVKSKTDLIPQNVRGSLLIARLATTEATLQEVCNVSGQGKLYSISVKTSSSADTLELKITIDGVAFSSAFAPGDYEEHLALIRPNPEETFNSIRFLPYATSGQNLINMEFDSTLLVELRRSVGTADDVICKALYLLDSF